MANSSRGRPPKSDDERRDVQLGVRADPETVQRLTEVETSFGFPLFTRAAIARAAVQVGLDQIERNPSVLFDAEPLTAAQAERIVDRCWPHRMLDSGAEKHADGNHVVYLLPETTKFQPEEVIEGRSKMSFRDAIEKLALKVPPKRPLPWQVSSTKRPRSRAVTK